MAITKREAERAVFRASIPEIKALEKKCDEALLKGERKVSVKGEKDIVIDHVMKVMNDDWTVTLTDEADEKFLLFS